MKHYALSRCRGGGCPYSASWLLHIDFYRRLNWFLWSTKMEEATFRAFEKPAEKFHLENPDAYFVHHLSAFEHDLHKSRGFDYAKNQTLKLTNAAVIGECSSLSEKEFPTSMIAFIPFYGGLPPNVTADLTVKSIGQGNSLVFYIL
jgi:hypothetical protein